MSYIDDASAHLDDARDGDDPWTPLHQYSHARSRTGALAVRTTAQGLPVAVRIDPAELRKHPDVLAADILRLCRQAAMSAGIRLRENLIAAGVDRDVISTLRLPRPDDLAAEEERADSEADEMTSWLRR
ncbi:hypothetical protein [Gordonia aurantiaca]|uniref:hypothetical protein n=1 Tax=Gordonia sp. B21 TaxID=3151852 RepID=UPI0032671F3A